VTARGSAQNPPQPTPERPAGQGPAGQGPAGQGPAGQGPAGQRAASERPAYEQARDELTELVKRLEAGGLTLEQSLALWERGERLAVICEEWLEGARARLAAAMIQPGDEGDAGAAPF
jgi:exodeoxyribonuclease VII small subunit